MPYGTKSEYYPVVSVVNTNSWGSGQQSWTRWFNNTFCKQSIVRSGTNAPSVRSKRIKKILWYKRKWVTIYDGPKACEMLRNKKTGKFYWKRNSRKVLRVVPVYEPLSKSSKSVSKGLDIASNALGFESVSSSVFTTGSFTGFWFNPEYSRSHTGDTWAPFISAWSTSYPDDSIQDMSGYLGVSSVSLGIASKLSSQLLPKLYSKVKNQSVNLAQALAERRQTISMFAQTATRLAKAFVSLKRGNIGSAVKSIFPTTKKKLADDTLMVQFGVKPLLSDLDGVAKHLAVPEDITFDIIVQRTEKIPVTRLDTRNIVFNFKGRSTVDLSGSVTVRYKVRCRVNSISREFDRLGFTNLSSLAWELAPYSFVADWFIPIGNYLNTMDAFSGVTIVSAHKTTFVKQLTSCVCVWGGYDANGYYWTSGTSGWQVEKIYCTREIINPNSFPKLPYPDFKDPVTTAHIVDAIALLTQLKGK